MSKTYDIYWNIIMILSVQIHKQSLSLWERWHACVTEMANFLTKLRKKFNIEPLKPSHRYAELSRRASL